MTFFCTEELKLETTLQRQRLECKRKQLLPSDCFLCTASLHQHRSTLGLMFNLPLRILKSFAAKLLPMQSSPILYCCKVLICCYQLQGFAFASVEFREVSAGMLLQPAEIWIHGLEKRFSIWLNVFLTLQKISNSSVTTSDNVTTCEKVTVLVICHCPSDFNLTHSI